MKELMAGVGGEKLDKRSVEAAGGRRIKPAAVYHFRLLLLGQGGLDSSSLLTSPPTLEEVRNTKVNISGGWRLPFIMHSPSFGTRR